MNPSQYIQRPAAGLRRASELISERMVRWGLAKGHRGYRRFIVLGWYRTGSNYLLSLLNSHPNLVGFSEVFYPKQVFWGNGVYGQASESPGDFPLREENPEAFLNTYVFRPYPKRVRAAGFKIFYPQLEHESFVGLADLLAADPDLHVIHLKRRNLLRILVSDLLAKQTGEKVSISRKKLEGKLREVRQIELDVKETEQYFERLVNLRDAYDRKFSAQKRKEIFYEDLRNDPVRMVNSVQEFLGLPQSESYSILVKQNTLPLSDLVSNYADLKQAFTGTPWQEFFR